MIIPDSKKIPRWVVVAVLFIVVLAIVTGIVRAIKQKSLSIFPAEQNSYLVPGVPYIGAYNHTGKFNQLQSDSDSAIASILEYWRPDGTNLSKIWKNVSQNNELLIPRIEKFVNSISGMKAEDEVLTLEELPKYISPQVQTPLIAFFAIDENQLLDNNYYPARVLIGVNESKKKLVFHDYWQGNNLELSFDDYNRLLEKTPPPLRNKYLVIQPVDLNSGLKEIVSRQNGAYPARTQTMEKAGQIFKYFTLAADPRDNKRYDEAIDYYSKAVNSPNFEIFFPPAFKVRLFENLAETQREKGNFSDAQSAIQKAIGYNHDLDRPFGDWPGYELGLNAVGHFGESSVPYRVQGDTYLATGDFQKAQENYNKALVIKPDSSLAQAGLAKAEEALSKK